MVQTVQVVEAVKTVHHRGQKSEIRDQLYPDLRHLISDLYSLPAARFLLLANTGLVPCTLCIQSFSWGQLKARSWILYLK